VQVRGSIEEAEELQQDDQKGQGQGQDGDDDGERRGAKPASRERQKELLGRLPPSDRPGGRGGRQMDHSPYESRQHQHHHQNYDPDDYY